MASPFPYPPPVGLDPLEAPLGVDVKLSFDSGVPGKDRMAEMHFVLPDIKYDQIYDVSVDIGAINQGNDISDPKEGKLYPLWRTFENPENVYVVAILLTVEFGYAALYFITGTGDSPDVDVVTPLPLTAGGFFFHVNDNDYEIATNWQGNPDMPIFIQRICATTFLPTRITGRIWLKNKDV
jgi:hypothetical protein